MALAWSLWGGVVPLWSQQQPVIESLSRQSHQTVYDAVYTLQPAISTLWEYDGYAYLKGGYTLSMGDYIQPQGISNLRKLHIASESVWQHPEKGWFLYGKVNYENGTSDGGIWNLAYELPTNGSPFYYMVGKSGSWKVQRYHFDVSVAKRLGKRFSLGASLLYHGNLYYRTVDSRNTSTNLDIRVTPSVAWHVSSKHTLALSATYERHRNESEISNKYQHDTDAKQYILYMNQGLGSWESEPNMFNKIERLYGGALSWSWRSTATSLDVIYRLRSGREAWKHKSYNNDASDGSDPAQYDLTHQELVARLENRRRTGRWLFLLQGSLLSGEGRVYKLTARSYLDNYTYRGFNTALRGFWYPKRGLLQSLDAEVRLETTQQDDISYGHSIYRADLVAGLGVDLSLVRRESWSGYCRVGGRYKSNLSADHTPKAAADNLYTLQIARPVLAYLTSDAAQVEAELGAEFRMGRKNRGEVLLTGALWKPVSYGLYREEARYALTDNYGSVMLQFVYSF